MLRVAVDISVSTTVLVVVDPYSGFSEEQETLSDLGATFRINSIDYDELDFIIEIYSTCNFF
jgi:hypothetical protein